MNNARHIEAEAAQWLSRRAEPHWTDQEQAEFERWLDQGFAYKAAWWRLEEGWEKSGRMSALGVQPAPGIFGRNWTGTWKPVAMVASLGVLVAIGLYQSRPYERSGGEGGQFITTTVGGHKIVPLADGSAIELNTATVVRATVSREKREIWLERGEAFFDVLHSASVPFVVHAGPKTIAVLGTKFSVRRDGDKVTVAVLSGRVRVTDAAAPPSATETYVAAGSVAVSKSEEILVTESSPQSVDADLAWRQGQLIFRNETLGEAAQEFNRYNDRKMTVSGKAAELKISGSFRPSNEDGFGRLLKDAYGLNVTMSDDEIRVTD